MKVNENLFTVIVACFMIGSSLGLLKANLEQKLSYRLLSEQNIEQVESLNERIKTLELQCPTINGESNERP